MPPVETTTAEEATVGGASPDTIELVSGLLSDITHGYYEVTSVLDRHWDEDDWDALPVTLTETLTHIAGDLADTDIEELASHEAWLTNISRAEPTDRQVSGATRALQSLQKELRILHRRIMEADDIVDAWIEATLRDMIQTADVTTHLLSQITGFDVPGMSEYIATCRSCGAEPTAIGVNGEARPAFCPHCGEELAEMDIASPE